MFGLSFLNTVFLSGLVAGAIPVVIHLLNRRRIRRIKFSSIEFLDEASRRRMRKINLRRVIILVLRTLAVLLLVLAFARPTIRDSAFFLPGDAPKNVVVCLDVSYSMGLEREQGTVFTLAKDIARTVVDEAGKDDAINVVLFAGRADAQFDQGTRNKQLVKKTVEEAELTAEATSIRKAVDTAFDLIERSDVDGGEVYVVSDFRFNEDTTLVSEDRRSDDVHVFFLPVYQDDADNVSIDRVMVPRKLLRAGEVVRVGVAVTNHSASSPANFPLDLSVNGERKAEKVIDLAPSASATVTFPVSFVNWGTYRCAASKNRDRLPIDDERFFLLDVSRSVPVTLLRGRATAPSAAAGSFYLEKALNPRATAEGEFVVHTVGERDFTEAALPSHGVVVWVDPQRLESRRMSLLRRYVERGGGLIVFLGGGDRRLWQDRSFRSFLGVQGVVERNSDVQVGYTSFQKDHPIFEIFDAEELELLSRTHVTSYVAASGVAPDSTLAFVGGGDPALWECARGKGRILVFAAAPDLESGDVPLSPMFLPLVHTAVSYLASVGAERHGEKYAGRQLSFDPLRPTPAASRLVIRDPDGRPVDPVVVETPRGDTRVLCERPRTVGFYQLMSDTTMLAQVAVNPDTRESDLTAHSLVSRDAKQHVVATSGDFARNLQEKRRGREVFAFFILLSAAALVAESILGRRA